MNTRPPLSHASRRESRPAGDREHLDVEGEAVQRLQRENQVRRVAREELEAALRVLETGQNEQAHRDIEGASAELPEERLPDDQLRLRQGPRSENHIRAPLDLGPEPNNFRYRGLIFPWTLHDTPV